MLGCSRPNWRVEDEAKLTERTLHAPRLHWSVKLKRASSQKRHAGTPDRMNAERATPGRNRVVAPPQHADGRSVPELVIPGCHLLDVGLDVGIDPAGGPGQGADQEALILG